MRSDNTATDLRSTGPRRGRLFTVETANQALVFVRKVVQDIVDHYAELLKLRAEREDVSLEWAPPERVEDLRRRIESTVEALNALHGELTEVGCELKDWSSGLVDFPALHEGRKVWLCWRLGEPAVTHWHELEAGFAGRRPVGPDFGAARPTLLQGPERTDPSERSR